MKRRKVAAAGEPCLHLITFKMRRICTTKSVVVVAALLLLLLLLLSREIAGQHMPHQISSRHERWPTSSVYDPIQQRTHRKPHHRHHYADRRAFWLADADELTEWRPHDELDEFDSDVPLPAQTSQPNRYKPRHRRSHHHHHQHCRHRPRRHHHHERRQLSGEPAEEHQLGFARLSKRQALEEAIHELRILESQDGQLRAFAESGGPRNPQPQPPTPSSSSSSSSLSPVDMNRLRQEEASAESIASHPGGAARDFHCHLKLMTNERPAEEHQERQQRQSGSSLEADVVLDEEANFCLRSGRLAAQIPPFMLNLYRQLSFDIRQSRPHLNFSETVQMMPYKAEIMRSFRQPKLLNVADHHDDDDDGGGDDNEFGASAAGAVKLWTPTGEAGRAGWQDKRPITATLEQGPSRQSDALSGLGRPARADDQWPIVGGAQIGNVVVELSVLNGSDDKRPEESLLVAALVGRESPPAPTSPACDLKQRLLPAHQRDEICFWFKLDDELPNLISRNEHQHEGRARERLVEAELHVFKLFPQAPNANQRDIAPGLRDGAPQASRQRRQGDEDDRGRPSAEAKNKLAAHDHDGENHHSPPAQQPANGNRTTTGNLYHLRTNLLEVSLYQILPRKFGRASEFPLRLLDIRRIDLNSNGWETFYVKRAVEDWLREPRLNLGLVIRAKSMFDEPIRMGLIRFADAYDAVADQTTASASVESVDTTTDRRRRQVRNSNLGLSHQPLLVIYTTRAD